MSLETILSELKLDQYLEVLLDNGFDTWDVVQDITEDDLNELGFRLGHRRILQRAIAESPIRNTSSGPSTPLSRATLDARSRRPNEGCSTKRRYRRHPRADPHAPKRPKTAYVMFADHLRTDPAVGSLSFTEISRVVGMRWQALPREEKYLWNIQAAQAMHSYAQAMDEYRKTDTFREHRKYLEQFQRRHQAPPSTGYDLSLPTQRPSLEASRGNSSSSHSSNSTRVDHSDDGAQSTNTDGTELPYNEVEELQSDEQDRNQKSTKSSIHALLQAAEQSDRC